MDHTCHRCNAAVPANTLFCGQCGAPQIRVATSESESSEPEAATPAGGASRAEFAATIASRAAVIPPVPTKARITWSTALPKAAIAGFATIVFLIPILSVTKSGFSLLVVIPLGGIFAIWLYARGKDPSTIVAGTGARIGAVAGLFSFLIFGIIEAAQFTTQQGMVRETVRKGVEEAIARNPNPEMQSMMNQVMTPEGIATVLTVSAIMFLFVFLIFGALGGSLGAAMLRNRSSDKL